MKLFKVLVGLLILSLLFGFTKDDDKKHVRKISANDHYQYIAANRCLMWNSNNGDGSHDPISGGSGFYWPDPHGAGSLIYEDGIIWGGKVGAEIRVNGNTHRQGMQAGKILSEGIADDPLLEKYRVYKIKKSWQSLPYGAERSQIEKDWNEWPVEDGAPWVDKNNDGKFTKGIDEPELLGDETLWYVMNDLDPNRTTFQLGTMPIGLEVQVTIFAFALKNSPFSDMVFKKYKFINKSSQTIRDMYIAHWTDDDLGDANDDYAGCDTSLQMGYSWNGDNSDVIYNDGAPPAVAHVLLQGPIVDGSLTDSATYEGKNLFGKKNLQMMAFNFYIGGSVTYRDPRQGDQNAAIEMYNNLKGLTWSGDSIINPVTNLPTTFSVSGDPVTGTGWFMGTGWSGGPPPMDVRFVLSSGPFNFAADDTQEVVFATVAARGISNLSSITRLRESSTFARLLYNNNFNLTLDIPTSELNSSVKEREVNLFWSADAESFVKTDPFIPDTIRYSLGDLTTTFAPDDKKFRFQAYRIYQFKDEAGSEPRLIAQYDIKDDITDIYYYQDLLFNQPRDPEKAVMRFTNTGIKYFLSLNKDVFTNEYFNSGSDYYFGITSVAYSQYSIPPAVESKPTIIKVIPGAPAIDYFYSMPQNYHNAALQSIGNASAKVEAVVLAPNLIKNDNYKVTFFGQPGALKHTLTNVATGKILIDKKYVDRTNDSTFARVEEGFYLKIIDEGYDSLKKTTKQSLINSVKETHGPDGVLLSTPKHVLNEFNSTGKWKLIPEGSFQQWPNPFESLNWKDAAGEYDYEIRFTESGSQFYYSKLTGINPYLKNDSLGNGKIPFEVWRTDQWGNKERMFIKIVDENLDKQWNYKSADNKWEYIIVYKKSGSTYQEPLPPTSGTITSQDIPLKFSFEGEQPLNGTRIKITTWKRLTEGNEFTFKMSAPITDDKFTAKNNLDKISVFPNPYFGRESFEDTREFVTFTNLPQKVTIRIYSLGGTFIQKLEKDDGEQYLRWDLKNRNGYFVGSGMYLAYLEMPGIGAKVMKVAVIQENRFYLGY